MRVRTSAAGRPWKARERLRSYVNAFPTDEEALELLGEVHYAMGDLPAAGAAWILCKRDDERTREAIEALRDESALLRVRAPLESWPPVVQERLRAFGAEPETETEVGPVVRRDHRRHAGFGRLRGRPWSPSASSR